MTAAKNLEPTQATTSSACGKFFRSGKIYTCISHTIAEYKDEYDFSVPETTAL